MNSRALVTELLEAGTRRALGGAAPTEAVRAAKAQEDGEEKVSLRLVSKIAAMIKPTYQRPRERPAKEERKGAAWMINKLLAIVSGGAAACTIYQTLVLEKKAPQGVPVYSTSPMSSVSSSEWLFPLLMGVTFLLGLFGWLKMRSDKPVGPDWLPAVVCSVVAVASGLIALGSQIGGVVYWSAGAVFMGAIVGLAVAVPSLVLYRPALKKPCRLVLGLAAFWMVYQLVVPEANRLSMWSGLWLLGFFWVLALTGALAGKAGYSES